MNEPAQVIAVFGIASMVILWILVAILIIKHRRNDTSKD